MPDKYFALENKFELLKIPLTDICYFEKIKSTHNVCVVYAGGIATFKRDLRDVLRKLDYGFVQCHKSFIANTARIVRIEKFKTYATLHFTGDISCPCSLLYKKAVMKQWKS